MLAFELNYAVVSLLSDSWVLQAREDCGEETSFAVNDSG
jgi:hypothetical protein